MSEEHSLRILETATPRITPHHYAHTWRYRVTNSVRALRNDLREVAPNHSSNTQENLTQRLHQLATELYSEIRFNLDYEVSSLHQNLTGKKSVIHSVRREMDNFATALLGQQLLKRAESALEAIPHRDEEAIARFLPSLRPSLEETIDTQRRVLTDKIEFLLTKKGEDSLFAFTEAKAFANTVETCMDNKFAHIPFVTVRSGARSV